MCYILTNFLMTEALQQASMTAWLCWSQAFTHTINMRQLLFAITTVVKTSNHVDLQVGPSVALWQAFMTAWFCWSQTLTQPQRIICFFQSQLLSTSTIMLACRWGHFPADLSVGGRACHHQPRGRLLRLADALLRCWLRGPHGTC